MDGSAGRSSPLQRLRELEELGPGRVTGSALEKKAQEKLGAELETLGFKLEWRAHTWTRSIYSGLMVHFGLGVAGTAATLAGQPLLGGALAWFAAVSYFLESMRRALLVRAFFPKVHSQNLLATLPAKKTMRRRLVTIAHADAAFTGLLFNPTLLKYATKPPPHALRWFHKQLGVGTLSMAINGTLSLLAALGVWGAPVWLFVVIGVPATLTFLLNLEVTVRNTIVPGAGDNLSGCTASVELAHRFVGTLPDDVELVIVISGSEEAGTGGALRLAQQLEKSGAWKKEETCIIGLDTLCNGTLRYLEEGEMWAMAVPPKLLAAIEATNAESELKATKYVIPSGATDALPFLVRGWDTVCLTCIDPVIGAPRNYHSPSDTWKNIDERELESSINYAEKFLRKLAAS